MPKDQLPEGEDKKKYKYAYFTRTMEQPVFLHNLSVLKTEIPPEWVVFQEVYEVQGKMYMRGVTAIDPTWLPDFCPMDCNLSKPLSEREPFFDQERGQVLTFRSGTFGERGWILPLIQTVHPQVAERTKMFAKFLLEGAVFPDLKPFSEDSEFETCQTCHLNRCLLTAPVAMIKTWGNWNIKMTKPLFEALLSAKVDDKQKLVKALSENPNFLLKEYLKWFDEKLHKEVKQIWLDLCG